MLRAATVGLLLALAVFAQSPDSRGARRVQKASAPWSPDEIVDLNRATLAQLRTLPGMTAVYAQRILDSKPYSSRNALRTRDIIPTHVFQQIENRIKVGDEK